MIALLCDIVTRGCIGFAGHYAAVGIESHSQGIGQFNPLIRIDINGQIPLTNLLHRQSGNQRKVTNDHESLDVVGVTQIKTLPNGLAETAHGCCGSPKPLWQRSGGLPRIVLGIVGHKTPVDASNVLAPTQNLANETFGGSQGYFTELVAVFDLPAHLERFEEPCVQI